ncbi:MAG: hypothetical protein IID51_09410 [Proteobacteria bacterium]|nr:hypothetical protein [Pseudomonadota bacterium]
MEQSLKQYLLTPDQMSEENLIKLVLYGHYQVEVVQFRELDSIAIDKKGLLGRMRGAMDLAADAGWKYFEGLKQAKKTGHSGGKAKQKGVEGENGQGAGGGERPWLAELARIREIISGRMVLHLPEPNGPPGANLGATTDWQSTDFNGGMSDGGE